MLGTIIGDIVGSTYEFNNTRDYDFAFFAKGSSFTDDTVCAIAVADAVMKSITYSESILKWCQKYPDCDYGGMFSKWLSSHYHKPYNSFGNGAAMRVGPIGWAFLKSTDVLEEAQKSAEFTHNHPEGIKGAQCIALCTWYLANHRNMEEAKNMADDICKGMYGSEYARNLIKPGVRDETCQGCVPLAVHIFVKSKTFEDAIRLAVSYGGDCDTLGAIVGSLAGAFYEIPMDIRDWALSHLPHDMLRVYKDFERRFCFR